MAALDTINQLEAKVQDQLAKAAEVKAQLEADVALHEQLKEEVSGEIKAAHDAGYEEGKASIQLPDKTDPTAQYTQEQLSSAVNTGKEEVRAELQPQIDESLAKIASLSTQIADIEAALIAKDEEIAAEKAAFEAYKAANIAQAQG